MSSSFPQGYLEALFDACAVVDADTHRVIVANAAFAQLLGQELGDVTGKPLLGTAALSQNDLARVYEALAAACDTGTPQQLRLQPSFGGVFQTCWVRIAAQPDTRCALFVFRSDPELRTTAEPPARLEKIQALGVLAGGIAHDLNNLVAGALGHVEMAREFVVEDKAARAVESLNEAAQCFTRARNLTRQLLTFSRGGAPHKTPGDLAQLVRSVATAALANSNIQVRIAETLDLPQVSFDSTQLAQVIENLATNAGSAMQNGGTLDVSFSVETLRVGSNLPLPVGTYMCVTLTDTGEGIPLENMPKLFEPFFTTRPNGTGLGLASSFSIIKRHGGHLAIQSELDKGTECRVYLPLETPPQERPPAAASTRAPRQARVLVMDDEDAVRRVTSALLMRLGYEVILAANGGEAIDIYRRSIAAGQPFAFVLLDLTVPGGLGGRETLETLRKLDAGVIAIASSGYSNDPILVNPEQYGFRAGLAKPYSRQEFLAAVGRVVGAQS